MFVVSAASAAENPAKQIKKQMCFETYPRTTYDANGSHDWTINEVIENPDVYKTYKFITANKTKTGDNVIFDFNGISRQYGKVVNASGSGFYDAEEGWTLNVNSSTKLGPRYSVENQPYATSLATWDMYANITDPGVGGGFLKFEAVGGQLPGESYEVSVVRAIDCKDFARNTPVVQ
jgi:uncharacterized membrane protein YfhO